MKVREVRAAVGPRPAVTADLVVALGVEVLDEAADGESGAGVLQNWRGRGPVFPELTDREREVLSLMAAGLNNSEISRRLFLSDKSVRNRVSAIFAKLGVRDRSTATSAREAGLGSG